MTMHLPKPAPISMQAARKTDLRSQFGALVFRVRNGKTQVLLITTRRTKRWTIPGGWPICGLTPAQSAAQEAWEEAGVTGRPHDVPVGFYSYFKKIKTRGGVLPMPVMSIVYPVETRKLASEFPEAGQRRRKWFSPKKAAARVREPQLAQMLRSFDPKTLR